MANNAVIAKSRAVHGRFLTKDDYVSLLHKSSIPAAVAYLKTKPLYSSVFADTEEATIHREQAEALINKNVFDNYLRICRFVSGSRNGIVSFYIKQMECEQLIKAVIAVNSGSQDGFVAAFPDYIADHMSFDPLKLAAASKPADMAEPLKGTMYGKALAPLLAETSPDINRIITTINVCYIKWAFGQIDKNEFGKNRERLKDFFLRKVDADNLLMCLRMKGTLKLDNERISELLIPYHKRLRTKEIDEALRAQDPVSVLRSMFVSERIAVMQKSDIPEVNVNISDYRFFRHRLAFCTTETEALYSLMMLFRAESTNLCRIIEGIRYGLPPEETEKYLIL